MTTIADIIGLSTIPEGERQVIVNALVAREDDVADYLRLTAVQYGLYPEIVAESIAASGLGSPPSEEERTLIRTNWVGLMEKFRDGNPPPPPGQ